jgi:hypothetical protein
MKRGKYLNYSLTIITCLLVITTSCSLTTKETIINGVVIDQSSESYVEGIPVVLLEEELGAAPFSYVGYSLIAETTTDSEGRFYFKEDLKNQSALYLVKVFTDDANYFGGAWQADEFYQVHDEAWVEPGIEQTMILPLVSYGEYSITAQNASEMDSILFDMYTVGSKYEHRALYEVINSGDDYTNQFLQSIPSGATQLRWELTGPEFDTIIYDSIYVTPHQRGEINFTFEG